MIRIIGVGDIMPGGLLHDSQRPCLKDSVEGVLLSGDIRVGTLECAFGNEPTYDQEKVSDRGNVIYAKDSDIRRLRELHIDLVTLANNHFFDLGPDGAKHTIELLDTAGVLHTGAGLNIEEANKPAVIEIDGKTIAFLGFCDTNYNNVFWCTYATASSPGVNPMEENHVSNTIKVCSKQYDYVVVMAHWGTEHSFYPNLAVEKMAKLMFDSGACLVLGSHPHRIQPVINKKNKSIAYSMGNFLFPERLIAPPKVTWYPEGEIDYCALPVTDGYPLVDTVTLKTLPYWGRIGMIVCSTIIESSVISDYYLTYLGRNNCLELVNAQQDRSIRKQLSWITSLLRLNLYRPFMLARHMGGALLMRIKRLLK